MNLFAEFSRKSPNKAFFGIVLGGVAGVCYAFLIPLVSLALAGDAPADPEPPYRLLSLEISEPGFAALFFALCVTIFLARFASRLALLWVSMDMSADLRMRLSRQLLRAPISDLDAIGPSRLTVVLTEDVNRIVNGAQVMPGLLTNVVSLVGLLGFLLYLNTPVFRLVMLAILVGVVTYQIPMYFGMRLFDRSRLIYDELQEALRGVIHGAKDLKSDPVKRENYFRNVLEHRQQALLRSNKRAYAVYVGAEVYGDMIGLFVIGAVSFVIANYYSLGRQDVVGIVMALLYVSGPIGGILNSVPQLAVARSSLKSVNRVLGEIGTEADASTQPPVQPWTQLRLAAAEFTHARSEHHDGFRVGPVDLVVRQGEITFIVGGNGSGKSTLGKLIALHYQPTAGTVATDRQVITADNANAIRRDIATIFSDYYLFDRLLGVELAERDDMATAHLARLGMADKVAVRDGVFSTLRLSDGQRRRIALMVALLDDKPVILFDEWAADQDPMFKDIFYHEVLPDLRARGKAVVVISHDDRYFHLADQTVVMESGRVVELRRDISAHSGDGGVRLQTGAAAAVDAPC